MKKGMKIISAVLLFAIVLSVVLGAIGQSVLAVNPDEIQDKIKSSSLSDTAGDISGQIIRIVQVIGTAVAIIMLIVLAIKYISAAPGEKADIKKSAYIYIVGAVLLFGAVGVLQIIKGFSEDAFPG